MTTWRRSVIPPGGSSVFLAVGIERIGSDAALNRVHVDLGIGLPVTGLLDLEEAKALAAALDAAGWSKAEEGMKPWKL